MATVAGSKRLLDISGNNVSTAVSLTASGTLLDTNGAAGASNQVLSSTGSGVDWVDASNVIGGPYLPLAGGTLTGDLTVNGNAIASGIGVGTSTIYSNSVNLNNSGTLRIGNAEFLAKAVNDLSIYQGKIRVQQGGNVGIGTTSPGAKLDVNGEIRSDKTVNGISFSSTGGGASFSAFDVYTATNGGLLRLYDENGQTVNIDGRSASGDTYFNNGGNVGIGTTSPSEKLDVAGNAIVRGDIEARDTYPSIYVNHSGTAMGGIRSDATNKLELKTLTTAPLSFQVNSSERMRITSTGNVGIGTTSPNGKLTVVSNNAYNSGGGLRLQSSSGADRTLLYLSTDHTNQVSTIQSYRDGTGAGVKNLLINPQGGNVGIGTTNPGTKLHVGNGSGATVDTGYQMVIDSAGIAGLQILSATTQSGRIVFGDSGDNDIGMIKYDHTDNSMGFRTNGSGNERMRINSSGNVGIGTTSPDSKLDVKGPSAVPADGNQTLSITNTTGGTQLNLGTAENAYGWIEAREGNTSRNLLINPNGSNVGIGLINPAKTLDVFGTGRFYDDLTLSENLRMDNRQTGVASSPQPRISRAVLESSIETGNAVVHPYFNNDLANFVARGGTITVGGVTTQPGSEAKNVMFQPSNQFMVVSGITGSTWSITLLSAGDASFNLTYGCYIGITFGSGSFDPDSMIIEGTTDATGATGWTTALNSSVSSTTYSTYLSSGGTGIKAIRFTMGYTSGSPRVNNIFAYNYASKGMTNYFLGKHGGKVYGNIETTSFGSSAAVNLINNSGSSYFNGGNVGIGTTSPSDKLDVFGDLRVSYDASNFFTIEPISNGNVYFKPSGGSIHVAKTTVNNQIFLYDYTGSSTRWGEYDASSINLKTSTNTTGILLNTDGNSYINTGNVGIGTTNPGYPLEVKSASPFVTTNSTGTSNSGFAMLVNAGSNGVGVIATDNGGSLTFDNGATGPAQSEKMRITSTGNVGIGTTSPGYTLDVNGSLHSTNINIADGIYHEGDTNTYMQFHSSDQWRVVTGGTERLEVNNTQVTVANNLQVGGSIYASQYIYHAGDTNTYMRFPSNDTISWNTAGSERMRINSSGNIGIGTTAPSYKLHVAGNTYANGSVIGSSDLWLRDQSSAYSTELKMQNNTHTIGIDYQNNETLRFITRSGVTTVPITFAMRTGTINAANFTQTSDERLKTKISDLSCDNIDVSWKSFEMKDNEGEYRTGVVAQELEQKHPEFVNTNEEGFKSVKYIDLLIAKIAELEARLEKLEK